MGPIKWLYTPAQLSFFHTILILINILELELVLFQFTSNQVHSTAEFDRWQAHLPTDWQ